MADNDRFLKIEGVEESCQVRGEVLKSIARIGMACITMPSLCQSEGMDGCRQVRQHALEIVPGTGDAVQENYWNPRRIALLNIGKPYLVEQISQFDCRCHSIFASVLSGRISELICKWPTIIFLFLNSTRTPLTQCYHVGACCDWRIMPPPEQGTPAGSARTPPAW